jgi:hypothetical protein
MDGDTALPSPGDRVGGNMADDELSVLLCSYQLSCTQSRLDRHRSATVATYMVDMRRLDTLP